ncbi:MAG: hypothetical protein ACTSRA_20380 [Promethearchaeota archaeon]
MHNNKLESFPETIGNLTNLKKLYLSDNDELMSIHDTISNLKSLEKLYIDMEQLSLLPVLDEKQQEAIEFNLGSE